MSSASPRHVSNIRHAQHIPIRILEPRNFYCSYGNRQNPQLILLKFLVHIERDAILPQSFNGSRHIRHGEAECSCGVKSATVETRSSVPPTLKTAAKLSSETKGNPKVSR